MSRARAVQEPGARSLSASCTRCRATIRIPGIRERVGQNPTTPPVERVATRPRAVEREVGNPTTPYVRKTNGELPTPRLRGKTYSTGDPDPPSPVLVVPQVARLKEPAVLTYV